MLLAQIHKCECVCVRVFGETNFTDSLKDSNSQKKNLVNIFEIFENFNDNHRDSKTQQSSHEYIE